MRKLGDIQGREQGEKVLQYLKAQDIGVELLDGEGEDVCEIWVVNEDQLFAAHAFFKDFLADPSSEKFEQSGVTQIFTKKPKKKEESRARNIDVRSEVWGGEKQGFGTITVAIIAVSCALTLMTEVPDLKPFTLKLYFSQYYGAGFTEILNGQVWRLITPIFLHGGILHLVFNMMWLYQLGGQVEAIGRTKFYVIMVLVLAVLCNVAQYLISGPMFIGMSGVVYGLLGFVWMMSKFGLGSGYNLSQQTVVFMLIWLVICLVGIIPGVANTQHIVGFLVGTIWGFIKSGGLKTIKRQMEYKSKLH